MRYIYLAPMLLILSACATLSKNQCQQGDWYGIGLADGRAGMAMNRLAEHNEACAEYGIVVNATTYLEGRSQGLIYYCRLGNAFVSGLQGQRYQYVCPPAIDAVFARCNAAAYHVYELRNNLNSIDNKLSNVENQLKKKGLSNNDYYNLRQDLRDLDKERDRVQMELRSAERHLDQLRTEVGV
jgi:hypothetical protein